MIAFPFLYFSLLTFYLWKRHQGFDVCVYIAGLYAFTSFLSIIIVVGDMLNAGGILFDDSDLELSLVPTLLYCLVITLGILPFSMLYKKDLKVISTPNPLIIYGLSWFLIGISFINLYLIADSTLDILSGDLATIRTEHYQGMESPAQIKAESMPPIIGYLYYFNTSTLLAIPLFFYYLCFEKRAWWFISLLFFASLSVPLLGIQVVDRTEIMFYAMMFLSCLFLFHKFLSSKIKRIMWFVSIPMAFIMLVYIVAVSQARFEDREGGAETGAIQYAGQNYLNFCFFWEKAKRDQIATEREFPLINHYLFHIDNNDIRRRERSGKQGFFISVFPSYAGDIMLDLSPMGLIIWVLAFFFLAVYLFRTAHREELSVGDYLAYFSLSVIPIFGVFYYRYMVFSYTLMLLLVAFVYVTDKFKIKIRCQQNEEIGDLPIKDIHTVR